MGSRPATSNAWRIARTWPSPDGTSIPRPRPSFDRPTPRMMPWIVSPSATASSSRLERDETASLGRNEPVRVTVERPRPPAATQGVQRGETLVDEQVVGTVDRSRQHQVGDAVVQSIAGQFDRVQAARTGRVQGERADAQPERTFEQQRRQARREAVARPGEIDLRFGAIEPQIAECDGLDERRHARGGERQVAEDGAEP